MCSHVIRFKMVWGCIGKLNELRKRDKVILSSVLGHKEVERYETTDNLAKKELHCYKYSIFDDK